MKGRQENEKKIEQKIMEIIKDKDKILFSFYNNLSSYTLTYKRNCILHIVQYFEYLNKKRFKITRYENFKNIKSSDINEYMEYVKYARNSNGDILLSNDGSMKMNGNGIRASKFYSLSRFFDFLIDDGYIDTNPCDRVKPPKERIEREVVALEAEDIRVIENNIKDGCGKRHTDIYNKTWGKRNLAIINLGCITGLRATAISEINLEDIDFQQNIITVVEKGNVERPCYIDDETASLIKDWISCRNELMKGFNSCDALFISNRRKRINQQSIADMIQLATKDLDKKITPHKMRSTCAHNLYQETGDIYLVAEVLGHKNIANTRKYASTTAENKRRAADILSKKYRKNED